MDDAAPCNGSRGAGSTWRRVRREVSVVICFPGRARRAPKMRDCARSPNGILVRAGEAGGAAAVAAGANATAHPGRRKAPCAACRDLW